MVVYGRGTAPGNINNIKIGSRLEIFLNRLIARVFDLDGFCAIFGTRKLIKNIKKFSPDIVHLHNLHGDYINLSMLFNFLKKYNKPVVWTLHDCWALTGHCSHFDYIKCEKWKNECNSCPQKKSYPKSIFLDRSKRNYKQKKTFFTSIGNLTVVTPSKWLAGVVKESFLKDLTVKVINNGIDLEVFKPTDSQLREKLGLTDEKIIMGCAFSWTKRKGLDVFCELADMIEDEYKIVLVGVSEELAKELPENIITVQKTGTQNELAEFYSIADFFVNPTKEETLGMVNIEANACGTPVITFNTGGSPECINEKSGIVTKNTTAQDIFNAIASADFSREDCVERGVLFDKKIKYEEYIQLYKNIINKTV